VLRYQKRVSALLSGHIRNMDTQEHVDPQTQIEEGAQEPQSPVGDSPGGEELSPFEKQLQEIQAEKQALENRLKERERQLELKDKALKRKAEGENPEIEQRLEEKLQNAFRARDIEQTIQNITTDKSAQDLIKYHIENTIKPSGNVQQDIQTAWAIVNQKAFSELMEQKASVEAFQELVAKSQMGGSIASNPMKASVSPARRQAEEILKHINPEAIKHLKI